MVLYMRISQIYSTRASLAITVFTIIGYGRRDRTEASCRGGALDQVSRRTVDSKRHVTLYLIKIDFRVIVRGRNSFRYEKWLAFIDILNIGF